MPLDSRGKLSSCPPFSLILSGAQYVSLEIFRDGVKHRFAYKTGNRVSASCDNPGVGGILTLRELLMS
jgi:hypothetical protein